MADANHKPERIDILDREGIVAGLIGQDIQQSLTPSMHMAEARAQGLAYVYRLIDLAGEVVSSDRLAALVRGAVDLGYNGLNITHPFKQAVMPHLDAIDPVAEAIGAVNTVKIVGGRTKGFNTDAFGFTAGIKRDIGDIAGQSVIQLGAGGAGAATAAAALALGVRHVTIFDTDPSRAEALAQRLAARFDGRASAGQNLAAEVAEAHGLIHATPTGMAGHPGLPIDPDLLTDALWVAEIVYFPLETELLRVARERGCRTAHGGTMAVFQAVGAFEIFAAVEADADRMVRHFASLTGGTAA